MRPNGSEGFTLIEVMVALVVMAIMSLMAWQGVAGIVRTREISEAALERTLRLETVISQWDQDLAALYRSRTDVLPISCDGQSVRLVRRAESGVQVVVWSLRPADDGALAWQRWAGPEVRTKAALDQSWQSTHQFQGNEQGQIRALNGLDEWQVYFFRGNGWSNCQSTGLELPAGVRIVLSFRPGSGIGGKLQRDTLLAL
jgi:general secretion pathway protein J